MARVALEGRSSRVVLLAAIVAGCSSGSSTGMEQRFAGIGPPAPWIGWAAVAAARSPPSTARNH